MGLGNPVPGRIQANGETWDRQGFIVTATFQQHIASGRAAGIDLGNGKGWNNTGGADVLSMEGGVVTLAGALGLANVTRVRHPNGFTSGYAHMATIIVSVGQVVAKGQKLGTVGMTGADAPHLHGGYTDPNGIEQDWWSLLDQNNQEEEVTAPAVRPASPPIGTFAYNGPGHLLLSPSDPVNVRFKQSDHPGPYDVLASYDLVDAVGGKPIDIDGKQPPQNSRDQVHLVIDDEFGGAAYVLRQDGTFTPAVGGGDTTAAYNAGVDAAAKKAEEAKK